MNNIFCTRKICASLKGSARMENIMNIKEAKQEIKDTVRAYLQKEDDGSYCIPSIRQRPILLMGPPGIGKTQIMEQIARKCRVALVAYTITHHTRQSAVGLPFIREEQYEENTYSVTEYTMSEIIASIYQKIKATGVKEGILFIDEINCVSETLAPTMLQFLQCKTFGNQAIPEGWIIIAAGNPPEYNKSVREFDMVTLDRVRYISIEADYEVWKEYAREKKLHTALLSYLELRPKNFYRVEADVDGLQFVTARGWEDLSELMKVYEALDIPITQQVIYEFLRHEDVAEDVAAYLELYRKYQDDYGIEQILQGKVRTDVYKRLVQAAFDERLSVVNLLLDGLNRYMEHFYEKKVYIDLWYAFLQTYRAGVESTEHPAAYYRKLLEEKEKEIRLKEQADFYTVQQKRHQRKLLTDLQLFVPSDGQNAKEAFETAKKGFADQIKLLEELEDRAGQVLEHAFDFMEDAFGEAEEMVIFVTELTMTTESASFLSEYECERYQKYNQKLLIGTRRRKLLSELQDRD